jgi:lysophospholipase L1-like esterase
MELKSIFSCDPAEKPLDNIVTDGGFVGIFRTIACVGDSLSSGELEARDVGSPTTYHDYFDYSWGQYLARLAGTTVYNFSRGGMTASEYCNSYADAMGWWKTDKLAQAYVIAMGCNDIFGLNQEIGSVENDVKEDWHYNNPTFCGYYARMIQHYKELQPEAKFFLITMPREEPFNEETQGFEAKKLEHKKLLHDLAAHFSNTYVIDLNEYAPVYDAEFHRLFFTGGHMNAAGYLLTGKMVASYIDYIIRHNMDDFNQAGFIGTGFKFCG